MVGYRRRVIRSRHGGLMLASLGGGDLLLIYEA